MEILVDDFVLIVKRVKNALLWKKFVFKLLSDENSDICMQTVFLL